MNGRLIFTFIGILMLFLGIIYAYFAFYSPVNQAVQQAKQQITAEEKLISALEGKGFPASDTQLLNTEALQKKVPVKLMDEKLLLDFEKAELLSGSLVTSIEFLESETPNNNGSENLGAAADEYVETAEQTLEGLDDSNEETDEPAETDLLETEELPAGVYSSHIQITAQADNYEEIDSFIETLEGQMRLLVIKELNFAGPGEAEKITGTESPIEFTLIAAVYYMPSLVDLLEDVPVIDRPYPANKESPFVTTEE